MNAKLLVVVDNTIKREVALQLPAVLGRSRKADITVVHPLISRRHCEISEDSGLLMLRDLASLNGTMMEGRRIELAPLLPEAEFTIGPLTFRVRYQYDGDLESVPNPRFINAEADGSPAFAGADEGEVPMFALDEALPADEGEFDVPGLVPIGDDEPEDVLPAESAPAEEAPLALPPGL